jgi:hypothetical protein
LLARSYTALQKRNNRSFFRFPAHCQGNSPGFLRKNAAMRHAVGKER